MRKSPVHWLVPLALLLSSTSMSQSNQTKIAKSSSAYAITNAHIVVSPGQEIENGTVIIRDGRVEAVGTDAEIPYDARVIDGDSLMVYAGFIDGLSHLGVPKPKDDDSAGRPSRTSRKPTYVESGIQPDRSVQTMVSPDEKSVQDFRKVGFTIAHVVPRGRMLPGQGAIVVLDGEKGRDMVLRPAASQFFQFVSAQGFYPGTPLGIMASLRNIYKNSERSQSMGALFASDPTAERPASDEVHAAFGPLVKNEMPLFVDADNALRLRRALKLQRELGFDLALANVTDPAAVADILAESGAPVFLSAKLPKEAKEDSAKTETPSMARTTGPSDTEAEVARLKARQAERRTALLEGPTKLAQQGVKFGFSTMDVPKAADVQTNLRRLVKAGLDEEAALAALTTDAAELLGISSIAGSVEVNKLANLVVTTGPYFLEKSKVKYVFVEGNMHEYDVAEKKASSATGDGPLVGDWEVVVTGTPDGDQSASLVFSGSADDMEGTFSTSDGDSAEIQSIEVDEDEVTFEVAMGEMLLTFTGTIDDNTMNGSVQAGGFGSFPFEATRTGNPEGR